MTDDGGDDDNSEYTETPVAKMGSLPKVLLHNTVEPTLLKILIQGACRLALACIDYMRRPSLVLRPLVELRRQNFVRARHWKESVRRVAAHLSPSPDRRLRSLPDILQGRVFQDEALCLQSFDRTL